VRVVRDVKTGAGSGASRGNSVKNLKSKVAKLGLALGMVGASVSAFAVGPASPDLTSLTPDFTTVTTGILAVAGAVIGVYVTWKGAKIVIQAVRGA
jgi:hypothetical protein